MGDGNHVSPSYRSSVLFSSSNSPWAVLHMPEEREQRIHYVRLSLFTQVTMVGNESVVKNKLSNERCEVFRNVS